MPNFRQKIPFSTINRSQFRLLALSFLFFSALLHWLSFALYVLSGCGEKLDVKYGRSLEMDLDQSYALWTILPPFLHQN